MFVVLLLLLIALVFGQDNEGSNKLNVHIIPHTHDDPGWLKTADEYYYGSNSSIYDAGVQYILTTVVESLLKNEERNFVYVEMYYFQKWYNEQTEKVKKSVKSLVRSGQLSFANGGWVMHDEAGSHYMSMIDQTTFGHKFLKEEFDYTPRVGWQIDPFGHSNTQASLLSAEVGFDALFFGRIDYADIAIRKKSQTLEFIWKGSKSQPYDEVFTGVFSDGNYGYPRGFCYDQSCLNVNPVISDPTCADNNIEDVVSRFAQAIVTEKGYTAGNNIAFKMGSDFHYQNAEKWFSNLDKIIKLVNERLPNVNVFYSNPTKYIDAKAAESRVWTDKTDDFFPYADCEHCYWAGYFTSRPTLKYFERISSSFLQTLKQFSTFEFVSSGAVKSRLRQVPAEKARAVSEVESAVSSLTAAVGLVNHHDAITGTSKQHVAYDYIQTLDKALTTGESAAINVLTKAVFGDDATSVPSLSVCRLSSNESTCAASQSMSENDELLIIAYNPQSHFASQQLAVSLSSNLVTTPGVEFKVFSQNSLTGILESIPSEIIPGFLNNETYSLVFPARDVPPMSTSNFIIRSSSSSSSTDGTDLKATLLSARRVTASDASAQISNGVVNVQIDPVTGFLSSISRVKGGKVLTSAMTQSLEYYISYSSSLSPDLRDPHVMNVEAREEVKGDASSLQPSGAYIFRPTKGNKLYPIAANGAVEVTIVEGREVSEIRQVFNSWCSQVIRVKAGRETVEFEWKVGPIPNDDKKGKEVVTHFKSDLATDGTIYTDSNGREFLKRVRDYRPTWELDVTEEVAGNYYPITSATYIRDEAKGLHLSVVTDRSQGVASIKDGEIELMIHRRLTMDDWRGVGEPLDETTDGITPYPTWKRLGDGITVSGKHHILLSDTVTGIAETRAMMEKSYLPFTTFYGGADAASAVRQKSAAVHINSPISTFSMMQKQLQELLPPPIQVITLEKWSESLVLVRIAHQLAVDESAELSNDVTIDLSEVFKPLQVTQFVEVTLSANQDKLKMLKNKIRWKSPSSDVIDAELQQVMKNTLTKGSKVNIKPMEVRTFFLHV